jgi:predicted CXXCH cytochrome family protein
MPIERFILLGVILVGVQTGTADPAVVNPHWQPDQCGECHKPSADPGKPIDRIRIDALCLRCHDGRQAPADPHPIQRPATGPNTVLPEGWPAVAGRLSCVTCHDILAQCDPAPGTAERGGKFLRGVRPSVTTVGPAYCNLCHVADTASQRHNPHESAAHLNGGGHDPCLHCHVASTTPTAAGTIPYTPLRRTIRSLCLQCHETHLDYFSPGHLDRVVPQRMRSVVKEAGLPLQDGRITCVTCHNPHGVETFPSDDPRSRGSQMPGESRPRLPLRGLRRGICGVCHGQ